MENFNSKILLNHAIDILKNASINDHEWSVGGGTVLNHYYHHRLSKDIDVFIGDIQMLSLLSPRFNDRAEDSLDYDEMANYISLTYPEGKLDFIVGAQLSKFKQQKKLFMGHEFDALQRHYTELEYNYNHLQSQYKKNN